MVRQKEKNRNGLEKERKNKPFKGGVFIFMERYFFIFFFFFFFFSQDILGLQRSKGAFRIHQADAAGTTGICGPSNPGRRNYQHMCARLQS